MPGWEVIRNQRVSRRNASGFTVTWWDVESSKQVWSAREGYPGDYEKGKVITGLKAAENLNATIFHAGTKLAGEALVTNGGRVLGVTCLGKNFDEAIATAYEAIPQVQFEGIYYRRDIGHRLKNA